MDKLSTEQVAKKLGIGPSSLSRYIRTGKITAPPEIRAGGIKLRLWAESDIKRLQEELPKIANGRKTRYKKKHSAVSTRQSAKAKATKPKKK